MLTLPPFKSAKDISAIQDLYFKIADYIPNNKVSNIIASPFKTNTKIFHEILLKLNTLNDLDSDRHFRITTAETKEKLQRKTSLSQNKLYNKTLKTSLSKWRKEIKNLENFPIYNFTDKIYHILTFKKKKQKWNFLSEIFGSFENS